jgi:hypothetical protein
MRRRSLKRNRSAKRVFVAVSWGPLEIKWEVHFEVEVWISQDSID